MSDSADLIAYLEQRRRRRNQFVLYAILGVACLLLAVLAVTAILHGAGVGQRTRTTVNISATGYAVTRTTVGGVPILP